MSLSDDERRAFDQIAAGLESENDCNQNRTQKRHLTFRVPVSKPVALVFMVALMPASLAFGAPVLGMVAYVAAIYIAADLFSKEETRKTFRIGRIDRRSAGALLFVALMLFFVNVGTTDTESREAPATVTSEQTQMYNEFDNTDMSPRHGLTGADPAMELPHDPTTMSPELLP